MRYLARSGALLGYDRLVREAGGDPAELLRAVGLPLEALTNSEIYLPYDRLAELYALTAGRLRMPEFGLRLGLLQGLEVAGALGAWLCTRATVGEALVEMHRHLGFHARGIDITPDTDGDCFSLSLSVPFAERAPCMQLLTLSLTVLAQGFSQLAGRSLAPTRVRLGFARPDADLVARYEEALHCRVEFGQETYRISYPVGVLAMPVAVTGPWRQRLLARWRDDAALARPLSMTTQAERAIAALLPTGNCRLATVAALVSRHPRTLQDDLRREGTRFDHVLRQVRERLACAHLAGSDIAITRLALDLGFAEPAVFSRAFRAWTGSSPRDWRARRRG